MKKKVCKSISLYRFLYSIALSLLTTFGVFGQGTVKGVITGTDDNKPLLAATVVLKGTTVGTASDLNGNYSLFVPSGTHTILFSYIGYETREETITIEDNQTLQLNTELIPVAIMGEEAVITVQARGQLKAINQQLASDVIVNVVSKEQIQELPDQNVAESVARLPGISVTRNAGEAQGVTIRGLAPKFNQIQIDGVPMSSAAGTGGTGLTSLSHSRSVDLSIVSQENLQGIEVYKTITADMDANTLGGTVNLRLGKAAPDFIVETRLIGSYNQQEKDFNQYNAYARTSGRFWDNKMGFQLSVNADQRNRGNDRLSAGYSQIDVRDEFGELTGEKIFRLSSGKVSDERLIKRKLGMNAIFDYSIPGTELLFSNFFTTGNSHSLGMQRAYGGALTFNISESESQSYMVSNSLRGTHDIFSGIELEWNLSHYRTKTESPFSGNIQWSQLNYTGDTLRNIDYDVILPGDFMAAMPIDGQLVYRNSTIRLGHVGDVKYVAKLDLKKPFYAGDKLSGFIKMGGLFKHIVRESREQGTHIFSGRHDGVDPLSGEYATDYDPNPVLGGLTNMGFSLASEKVSESWDTWRYASGSFLDNPLEARNVNYDITEKYSAAYLMLQLNAFDNLLTFIPGVRYEGANILGSGHYYYKIVSPGGTPSGDYDLQQSDETFEHWLPMASLKIKPLEWLDIRLAVTKTLSRPDYIYRVPYETVHELGGATKGEPGLKATTSWNYDLATSVYASKFGLISFGVFYKEISNFSYMITHFIKDSATAVQYGIPPTSHYLFSDFKHPENTHGISTIKGFEIEYQANLIYLPGFLSNFVFRANYTRLISSSFLRKYMTGFDENWNVYYDTGYRNGPMPTQPNYIANVSLGYDIGGLSIRFSTFFQGKMLTSVGSQADLDLYVEPYNRYDFSLRYRFNKSISILATGVNITNTSDISSLQGTDKGSSYQTFGSMYDFGVEVTF